MSERLTNASEGEELPGGSTESSRADEPAQGSIASLEKEPWGLHPRLHNTVSYSVAAAWMVVVAPFDDESVRPVIVLWVLHFVRRTLEALFVHRYSGKRITPGDFLSEYVYYWGFANWIAYGLKEPDWEPASGLLWLLGVGLFFLGEFGNAWSHLRLRNLRSRSGDTERRIPHGGMFELISCPHYLFEIITWSGFAILAHVFGAYGFLALGTVILVFTYALPRHRQYLEEFDGKKGRPQYPEQRKAILPFVL